MRYKTRNNHSAEEAEWKAEKEARQEARLKANPDFDPDYDSSDDESEEESEEEPIDFDSNIEVTIDPTIISDLEHLQKRLMILVDGDEDLASNIIEYSLVLCKDKGIFRQDIKKLIWDKYPNLYEIEGKSELLTIAFELGEIITGRDSRIHDPIKHFSNKKYEFYKELIREKIEEKVNEIFYPGGVETNEQQDAKMMVDEIQETSMIGDIETQFNDMDV